MYVIPYILPMLLGRTYDYNSGSVGLDIFDANNITQHTREISNYKTTATFSLIKTARDVNDLMDVSGEMSLKVASGLVNVDGMGSYLKEKRDKENVVEVLCRVKYETVTKTLATSAVTLPLWERFPRHHLGTHYVRSITYGGELVASLQFRAGSKKDAEKVEAKISLGLGIKGTLDLSAQGSFKRLQASLSDQVNVEIKYYGTVPVEGVAQDLQGLQKLIKDFHLHVAKVDKGRGNPIRAEIFPLHSLMTGSNQFNFLRNTAIGARMDEVNQKYDDVLTTVHELRSWVGGLGDMHPDIVAKISKFSEEVDKVEAAFYAAVLAMDITSSGDRHQFDKCLQLYKGDDFFSLTGRFMRKFRVIKKDITTQLEKNYFSNPMTNIGVFKENVVDMGKSRKLTGAVSVTLCKAACLSDDTCKSITYFMPKGSSGLLPTTNDICFINTVGTDDGEIIPVPHLGENTVRIYLRGKDYTWDDSVPQNIATSYAEELSLDDPLFTQNTDHSTSGLRAGKINLSEMHVEVEQSADVPLPPFIAQPPSVQFCPKSQYYVMCNDTSPQCFAALCEDSDIGIDTALCKDMMVNEDAQCVPCCNYPASRTPDALIQSCQERQFYTQCGGEALCLEHVSTAKGGGCQKAGSGCRRVFFIYGKSRVYAFCKGLYRYTGTECTCPSG